MFDEKSDGVDDVDDAAAAGLLSKPVPGPIPVQTRLKTW